MKLTTNNHRCLLALELGDHKDRTSSKTTVSISTMDTSPHNHVSEIAAVFGATKLEGEASRPSMHDGHLLFSPPLGLSNS